MKRPLVLMVLDGWGASPSSSGNAIALAPETRYGHLRKQYLATTVQAHGRAVGLMEQQMGDSNVGHLTIGSGRIIQQNLPRIFDAIQSDQLRDNVVLSEVWQRAQGHRLHIMGLLSPGGVHSHEQHLFYLMNLAARVGLRDVVYHLWLDGRDVAPTSALTSLESFAEALNESGVGRVGTVAGRYYAMDRDCRWDRTEKAYRAMVEGLGRTAASAVEALDDAYRQGETDEFVVPTVIVDSEGKPAGTIGPDDVVLVCNFRADRVRQITRALADENFSEFKRPFPQTVLYGMVEYDENFPIPHLFGKQQVDNNLAEWLSRQNIRQLHVAETEKYAHVTFFFNGGQERVYPGEERVLIPSPKVATYDLEPAMSAEKVADAVIAGLKTQKFDFILLNFANADMVGHTGKLESACQAVRVVDQQIGRIADAVLQQDAALVIVSDHGNAEVMVDEHGEPNTNHTTNPVPLAIVAGPGWIGKCRIIAGGLRDVAPTVLDLMELPMPAEMTGQSLLRRERDFDE